MTRAWGLGLLAALACACGADPSPIPLFTDCPGSEGAWCDIRNRACQERLWRYRTCLAEESGLAEAPPVGFFPSQVLAPDRVEPVNRALSRMRAPLQAMGFWPQPPARANQAQSVDTDGERVWATGEVLRDAPAVALNLVRAFDAVAQVRLHGAEAVFDDLDSLDAILTRDAALAGRADLYAQMVEAAWRGETIWNGLFGRRSDFAFQPSLNVAVVAEAPDPFVAMQQQLRSEGRERVAYAWARDQSAGVASIFPAPNTSAEFYWPAEAEPVGIEAPPPEVQGYTLAREDRLGRWVTLSILGRWTAGVSFEWLGLGPDRWVQLRREDGAEALMWGLHSDHEEGAWSLVRDLGGELPDEAKNRLQTLDPSGALPPGFELTLEGRCLVLRWAEDPEDQPLLQAGAEAWARLEPACL